MVVLLEGKNMIKWLGERTVNMIIDELSILNDNSDNVSPVRRATFSHYNWKPIRFGPATCLACCVFTPSFDQPSPLSVNHLLDRCRGENKTQSKC